MRSARPFAVRVDFRIRVGLIGESETLMIIQNYGKDERAKAAEKRLKKRTSRRSAAARYGFHGEKNTLILLPIPSSPDGRRLKDSEVGIAELFAAAKPGDVIAGYKLPPLPTAEGVTVLDLSRDETFTEENAKLTALATVGILLTSGKKSLAETSVGILGYGRIGKELLRLLLLFGTKVTVFTSGKEKRLMLGELGIHTVRSLPEGEATGRFRGLDILINTAPACLILPSDLPALKSVRVLELASGENLPKELKAERLPSLPARLFPESAGRLYADRILDALRTPDGSRLFS